MTNATRRKRLSAGDRVTAENGQAMEVESVVGKHAWCVWTEDGMLRRNVFNVRVLEKA